MYRVLIAAIFRYLPLMYFGVAVPRDIIFLNYPRTRPRLKIFEIPVNNTSTAQLIVARNLIEGYIYSVLFYEVNFAGALANVDAARQIKTVL